MPRCQAPYCLRSMGVSCRASRLRANRSMLFREPQNMHDQIRAVPSALAVTIRFPPGLNAAL